MSATTPRSCRGAAPAPRAPAAPERLGWGPGFAALIDTDALTETPSVRVVAMHRLGLQVVGNGIDATIPHDRSAPPAGA